MTWLDLTTNQRQILLKSQVLFKLIANREVNDISHDTCHVSFTYEKFISIAINRNRSWVNQYIAVELNWFSNFTTCRLSSKALPIHQEMKHPIYCHNTGLLTWRVVHICLMHVARNSIHAIYERTVCRKRYFV